MRVLVFGAGVLGSLYAAKLKSSGQDVTILARGERAEQVSRWGIILQDGASGARTATSLPVIAELAPEDSYDLIMVLVRRDQVPGVLPQLAANRSPAVLFMTNNAAGAADLAALLGRERVLLGFPGAGGARRGHVVQYQLVSGRTQPTTLGELSGEVTPRLRSIAGMLNAAGFPTAFSSDMEAWLKTHAVLVAPIANAFYYAGCNYQLAKSTEALRLLIGAVREGLRALGALGVPVLPRRVRILRWLPDWLLIQILSRSFATRRAELVMWQHANNARPEMQALTTEVQALLRSAGLPTPCFDRLCPKAPEG